VADFNETILEIYDEEAYKTIIVALGTLPNTMPNTMADSYQTLPNTMIKTLAIHWKTLAKTLVKTLAENIITIIANNCFSKFVYELSKSLQSLKHSERLAIIEESRG
jgi:hypothetical protein